jgi:hypothetical protein
MTEVAALPAETDAEIGLYLLEDVHEGRGRLDTSGNREAESMRLPGPVIWILTDYNNTDLFIRCTVESIEDEWPRRVNGLACPDLFLDLPYDLTKIRGTEFSFQCIFPTGLYLHFHLRFDH